MAGYVGNVPVPQATQTRQSFTATASQTSFPTIGYTEGFFDCHLNGVKLLAGVDFNVGGGNGSDVILATGAALNDILEVTIFDTFNTSSGTFSSTTLKNNVTLKNDTHEDSDGGRASKIIYQGEQSGGEISTLAEIQASHDLAADDQKGDLIFRTNDGSDGTSPTTAMTIDSAQNVGIGTSAPSSAAHLKGITSTLGVDAYPQLTIETAATSGAANTGGGILFLNHDGTGGSFGGSIQSLKTNASSGNTANYMRFSTRDNGGSVTERMRILESGGIAFNGDTAAANALNDYETGTFQMSVAGVSGGARGSGIYVKVGSLVHFQWYSGGMTVTSATPVITGLPFNSTDPHNSAAYSTFVASHNTYVSNANTGYININTPTLYFTALNSTAGASINTGSNIYIMVAGTYHAA